MKTIQQICDEIIEEGTIWVKGEKLCINHVYPEKVIMLARAASRLAEALDSIAANHKLEYINKSYWLTKDIDTCAHTVATDTEIAREVLNEVQKILSKDLK